ncbi:hypothetical protein I4U23_010470 [Adineta vaga]|nr:hypothetical protein I4U23_010470 [Adineta vaga]
MDSPYEHRHRYRRRYYQSPPSSSSSRSIISSRDDDDDHHLEQEIIDRALEIERSRERNLRRQFEYIVHNIKKLERRRYQRHRTRSPTHYESSNGLFHRRSSNSYRSSSSERYYLTNESSSYSRSPSKSKQSIPCQITMIYQGIGNDKHGDEIMVLQENIIVFKGFLRADESFTFKFQRHHRRLIVKLEFFINELFECRLSINCENQQIDEENDIFQLQHLESIKLNRRRRTDDNDDDDDDDDDNQQRQPNEIKKSIEKNSVSKSRQQRTTDISINGDKRSTVDNDQHRHHHHKSSSNQTSKDRKRIIRENSYTKQRSHRSPSPTKSSPKKSTLRRELSNGTHVTTSNTDKKAMTRKATSTDDDNVKTLVNTTPPKPNYGPPQLSAFIRSSSESNSDEFINSGQENGEKKSSIELTKPLESSTEKKDAEEEEEEEEQGGNDSPGFTGFLQLLQAMSGGAISIPSNNDDGDGVQGLLARLGIITQTNSRKKLVNLTPRQDGNVENFLLVYLNSSKPDDSIQQQLRGLVNSLKIFDDPDDCIAFINAVSNEKIIFIVTDALGDPVVSRIQDLQQLFAIYVLCQTDEQTENWSTNQPKIHGIYTIIDEILVKIKQDIENDQDNSLTFTCSLSTTNVKEEPFFLIHQIIKEILLDPDEMTEAKNELIHFCQMEYQENSEQLNYIEQFENHYQKENVLKFYQKHQFLYKMLNKAFRIPEVDILFKLRLFIQNLHQFIISSSNNLSIKTLYRSQLVTEDELETLKKCVNGGYIAFSNFFFASTTRPIDKELIPLENHEEILFEIDVFNSNSYMSIDENILVTFGLVTRIESIDKDKNGKTIVHLKTITGDDRQFEGLLEPMRKEIRAPHPSLRIVKLFIELEQYSHAVYLGQVLLANSPNAKRDSLLALARTYHSLGTALYEKEEFDDALDIIKKSHDIYIKFLPEDAPQLSPTWNNLGSIYLRQGNTELALEYHQRALTIQLKSPSPDLPSIISYSNNIGGVYLKLERYDEALVHFKRALQIEEQTLPTNHPELAGTYHRIGGVYFRQNNYEKALEYYNKTLEIELAALPDHHPTVAVTYHNRGTALEGLGKLEEAVESAEKAVERLLKTLPKEHPQVRMNQAYADRLKQKLWVKQLFTS